MHITDFNICINIRLFGAAEWLTPESLRNQIGASQLCDGDDEVLFRSYGLVYMYQAFLLCCAELFSSIVLQKKKEIVLSVSSMSWSRS